MAPAEPRALLSDEHTAQSWQQRQQQQVPAVATWCLALVRFSEVQIWAFTAINLGLLSHSLLPGFDELLLGFPVPLGTLLALLLKRLDSFLVLPPHLDKPTASALNLRSGMYRAAPG